MNQVLLVEGVRVSLIVESDVCDATTDSAFVDHVGVVVEVSDGTVTNSGGGPQRISAIARRTS